MVLPFQPVRVRYGYAPGDGIQPIPSIDPQAGGGPLLVSFSEDLEDPAHHHSDSGGVSVLWGPNIGAASALVDGTVSLWIRDLWAPSPGERTEFQVRLDRYDITTWAKRDSNPVLFAAEYYAPLQHDDRVWDDDGQVVLDAPGHAPCNAHVQFSWTAEEVASDECLRIAVAQFHRQDASGCIRVPEYDLPYPGHVWRAQARMKVWPR